MISKSMSYLLRHGALKEGVPIQPCGKMRVTDLLIWLNTKGYTCTHEDVLSVVDQDGKTRYGYDPIDDLIWATQGHSMDITVPMNIWTGSGPLIHASYAAYESDIKKIGLSRMTRQHIHMIDPNKDMSWRLIRRNSHMYVIVDTDRSKKLGIEFLEAENGVILSSGLSGIIPPDLLTFIHKPRSSGCYGFIVKSASDSDSDSEVLMVKTKSGKWGFPKGKRHKNEYPLACAIRELYEETGLRVSDLVILPTTKEEINESGNCPTVYFTATLSDRPVPVVNCIDHDEGLEAKWMSMDEISQLSDDELIVRRRKLI